MKRDTLEQARDSLFIDKIQSTFKAADADLLIQAYTFSQEKSCGDNLTGYRAANLLFEQSADAITIASALLAPLIWQDLIDAAFVRERYGPDVAIAVEDLHGAFSPPLDAQPVDVNALLASMTGVPRKAILYITFRLLGLECNTDVSDPTVQKMAQETIDFLVPIADRLSLGNLRHCLEDACFRILDPNGYGELQDLVKPIQLEDEKCLGILLTGVKQLLVNNGVRGKVEGRTKSLYGIHSKMARTGKSLDEIMDRIGIRVIVTSVPECYTVLGIVHSHFKPIPGTFDDYIGLPKNNGYQSLHTCIYPVREISHKPIEFQIRTELMHRDAEHGTAAHWRYKSKADTATCNQQQMQWMEGLIRQHQEANSIEAFVERLHRQVFRDRLIVFGNGGRIVRLAENSTVRDYLKIINAPAPQDMKVKVNGRVETIEYTLRDGDSIEVPVNSSTTSSDFNAYTMHNPFFVAEKQLSINTMVNDENSSAETMACDE